ncbi:MAG: NAD-dependent epimerase/dehydratase family protein, partial [Verrucomicrobiota bacterium]
TFEETLAANIIGTHNVFEAAVRGGVERIVYASSHHAVGFTPRGACPIDHRKFPRPDGEYGLSKAYGEAAAAYYVDNFARRILTIRIGYVGEEVITERRLHTWSSPRDLEQLIHIGLTHPDLHHEIVYGASQAESPFFDNSNAFRLGYKPRDRAIDHVRKNEILTEIPDLETISGGVIGGGFAEIGFKGNPGTVLSRP